MADVEVQGEGVVEAGRQEMSAEEALGRLREGETLRGVCIVNLTLSGEFEAPVEMRRVTLVGCRIEKAVFKGPVVLSGCTLKRLEINKQTVFEQGLKLNGSELRGFGLRRSTVRGSLSCDNVQSYGALRVSDCELDGVRLWQAHFSGWTDFKNCRFTGQADLRSFHAEEGFVLQRCTFEDDVLFRGATVTKKLDLSGSRFEGLLDFSKAKLHDFAYLQNIRQGPRQRFAFANVVGSRIQVDPAQLQGRLKSEDERKHAVAMVEYGLLKLNYQTLHRYEEEDWAFYRFKINERRNKPRSWLRPWSKLAQGANWLILDHGCGYGTNPFRAVRAAVVIMALFAVVYAVGSDCLRLEAPLVGREHDSLENRALMGVLTSVSVFTAGFTGDQLYHAHGWVLAPLAAEALLGTLLWGLFIVAFSRKIIR